MKLLSPSEVHAGAVTALGLDPSVFDLTGPEVLAAAIRRAAGFLCPCPPGTLVKQVTRTLYALVDDLGSVSEQLEDMLEAVIAYGDLLEYRDVANPLTYNRRALIYTAPPSFVYRESGAALLLGVTPDHNSAIPEDVEKSIEYENHVRRILPGVKDELRSYLSQLGLVELSHDAWLKAPPDETAAQHFGRLEHMLNGSPQSGDISDLTLLDPSRPILYYRGRWVKVDAQSGHYVSRRPQAYGADLWCYVEIDEGRSLRLVDLPLAGSRYRGCDEAWRLQAAIDAVRGTPQQLQVTSGPGGTRVVKFFSPVPMWARRRWDSIGRPVIPVGCLFAYCFPDSEIEEELRFAREKLWLTETTESAKK